MEFDNITIWNILLTMIIGPLGFLVRNALSELKRVDILLNRTREEIGKEYVTRDELEKDMERLHDILNKIDEKIDRLQHKTYFQE